jgi:hypothetical protein
MDGINKLLQPQIDLQINPDYLRPMSLSTRRLETSLWLNVDHLIAGLDNNTRGLVAEDHRTSEFVVTNAPTLPVVDL